MATEGIEGIPATSNQQPSMAQFKGKTALIVDDFPTARRFIRNTMEELEFTCIEAGSATQALDLLEYEIPDVILTDLNMPEKNGMELLRELRGRDGFWEVFSHAFISERTSMRGRGLKLLTICSEPKESTSFISPNKSRA